MNPLKTAANAYAAHMVQRAIWLATFQPTSKYPPHQGAREIARRLKRIAKAA